MPVFQSRINPNIVGLVSLEDMLVMMDEMNIDTGIDIDRMLALGNKWEKTIGRRLRSESILNERIPKEPRPEYKRKGLAEKKAKRDEAPGQLYPKEWSETVELDPEITGKNNFIVAINLRYRSVVYGFQVKQRAKNDSKKCSGIHGQRDRTHCRSN